MFFFKKIVAPLFYPVPLCLEFLLLGLAFLWFTRRQKTGKILVSLGTGLFLIFSYSFVPGLLAQSLEQKYPPVLDPAAGPGGSTAKYIVVLGGGHISDPKLPVTSQIRAESLYRVLEGVRLYKAKPGRKLILSGGGGDDPIPESRNMARIALIMGVNPADIIQESASRDTEEQARLIKPLVGREEFFLVTSASHLPRAMLLFRKQGLSPEAAPAGPMVAEAPYWRIVDFFPTIDGLYLMEFVLHEYLGLAWAKLRGMI
ncbi:MAG: YdcF family protein [Deltaproteobacteria bacterium]|nr:YdcF family protein [Deltaproteobacteria bacterium]